MHVLRGDNVCLRCCIIETISTIMSVYELFKSLNMQRQEKYKKIYLSKQHNRDFSQVCRRQMTLSLSGLANPLAATYEKVLAVSLNNLE